MRFFCAKKKSADDVVPPPNYIIPLSSKDYLKAF